MKAELLYQRIHKDFVRPGMSDDWALGMGSISDFLCDSFKATSIGLVCDFATEVTEVRSAVFPSAKVMQAMLDEGFSNAMLFVHHPAVWDIRRIAGVFYDMDRGQLEQFKARKISVFSLHAPLDNFGIYSTTVTLAKALGIEPFKAFAPYNGGLCGVFGNCGYQEVGPLQQSLEKALGHRARLYSYGAPAIKGGRVALVAGGGNQIEVLEEIVAEGLNTFVTGVSVENVYSKAAHEFAREHGINILGGTHYSTEAFACQAICAYFEGLGIPARFMADEPILEDM